MIFISIKPPLDLSKQAEERKHVETTGSKLEAVFMSHPFCDLGRTSAFAEVRQPQLPVPSAVPHPPGQFCQEITEQTEHRNSSAFVRHSWESCQYESILLHKQRLNMPLQHCNLPGLFRCKKAESFKADPKTLRTLMEAMVRDTSPKIPSSSLSIQELAMNFLYAFLHSTVRSPLLAVKQQQAVSYGRSNFTEQHGFSIVCL